MYWSIKNSFEKSRSHCACLLCELMCWHVISEGQRVHLFLLSYQLPLPENFKKGKLTSPRTRFLPSCVETNLWIPMFVQTVLLGSLVAYIYLIGPFLAVECEGSRSHNKSWIPLVQTLQQSLFLYSEHSL